MEPSRKTIAPFRARESMCEYTDMHPFVRDLYNVAVRLYCGFMKSGNGQGYDSEILRLFNESFMHSTQAMAAGKSGKILRLIPGLYVVNSQSRKWLEKRIVFDTARSVLSVCADTHDSAAPLWLLPVMNLVARCFDNDDYGGVIKKYKDTVTRLDVNGIGITGTESMDLLAVKDARIAQLNSRINELDGLLEEKGKYIDQLEQSVSIESTRASRQVTVHCEHYVETETVNNTVVTKAKEEEK